MKKVLRTIIIMILLIIAFVFYMKWFDTPLAKATSNFIFQAEVQTNDCISSGESLNENDVLAKLNELEDHMNTLEDLIEINNASSTPDQFEVTSPVDVEIVDNEKSEEELFEEFKTWRENNK